MPPPSLDTVNRLIGLELDRVAYSYDERDAALYALGIGAPADWLEQDELKFVYELSSCGFQVYPTFPVVFASELNRLLMTGHLPGIEYNPMMVVHGEQFVELDKPLPLSATVESTIKIAEIFDKGSGMLMIAEIESFDEAGDRLALARSSMFFRGFGGFGGKRGKSESIAIPERCPDIVHEEKTSTKQALLYRLAGDPNPLHADPQMAAIGNYEKPILHGLCTFGYAGRAILKHLADNNASRLRSIGARFSSHVFPGETLVTEIWSLPSKKIVFQTKVKERDAIVLSHAQARLRS